MGVGDLIKVRTTFSFLSKLGIIVGVDHDFYKMHRGNHQDRLHILWQCGSISFEPESYVRRVSNAS